METIFLSNILSDKISYLYRNLLALSIQDLSYKIRFDEKLIKLFPDKVSSKRKTWSNLESLSDMMPDNPIVNGKRQNVDVATKINHYFTTLLQRRGLRQQLQTTLLLQLALCANVTCVLSKQVQYLISGKIVSLSIKWFE